MVRFGDGIQSHQDTLGVAMCPQSILGNFEPPQDVLGNLQGSQNALGEPGFSNSPQDEATTHTHIGEVVNSSKFLLFEEGAPQNNLGETSSSQSILRTSPKIGIEGEESSGVHSTTPFPCPIEKGCVEGGEVGSPLWGKIHETCPWAGPGWADSPQGSLHKKLLDHLNTPPSSECQWHPEGEEVEDKNHGGSCKLYFMGPFEDHHHSPQSQREENARRKGQVQTPPTLRLRGVSPWMPQTPMPGARGVPKMPPPSKMQPLPTSKFFETQ